MSKMTLQPAPGEIAAEWVELDIRIYTGPETGYTEIVHLMDETPIAANSVACEAFWREDSQWGFIFKSGHVCLVNQNSVRYVKGRFRWAIEAETQHDDVVAVEQGLQKASEETVHPETVAPKRRGRPPKARE